MLERNEISELGCAPVSALLSVKAAASVVGLGGASGSDRIDSGTLPEQLKNQSSDPARVPGLFHQRSHGSLATSRASQ